MKNRYYFHSLICLLAVSCTVQEFDTPTFPLAPDSSGDDVFYASLESYSAPDTRVSVDENIKFYWDAADQISIFNRNSQNQSYQFSGETGDKSGTFTRVSDPVEAENNLGSVYAVYPYQLTFPSVQTYKAGSFGPGANLMVSMTDDNFLSFKNLGGYLVLKFTGSGSIKSIKLEGNGNEPLSGKATVTTGVEPAISMASTAGTSITLNCETPVELGSTPTIFWMVVPPTTFTQGFTLTVTDPNGYVFFKETTRTDLAITRNSVLRIAPIAVSFNTSGISFSKNDITLVVPQNKSFPYSVDEEDRTFTVTVPTLTDFSNLNFDFGSKTVYADGIKITNGETPIDASKDVTLTVRNGQYGKNYTLKARNTGLPVVRITTENFTLSDIESKRKYKGSGDNWIDERVWRPTDQELLDKTAGASIRIEKADGKVDCEVATQIKGRGNASWNYNKKPYALKLGKKTSVLGMPKHKRWVLLANWKDRTLLRNDATFWLSQQVSDNIKSPSFPYSVHGQFVELEFNGQYRGNYYLCEQIKIDKNRLNLTEIQDDEVGTSDPYLITGPYIMEIDNNYDEQYKFKSGFYGRTSSPDGLKYMFHEPDENLSEAAQNYMKDYIQSMETLIKKIPDGIYGYRRFLDMDSAIWFMFINELTGNGDFFNTDNTSTSSTYYGPHSTFLYKDRDKEDGTLSKLFMGPVWDFDYLTFCNKSGRSNRWVGVNQSNYYYYYLTQDPQFRSRAYELWSTYKPIIESAMLTYIENMKDYISLSEPFNTDLWGWSGTEQDQNGDNGELFVNAVAKMKTAFTTKLNFMDSKITKNATASNYRN